MSMNQESLTIEETLKLREQLGLPTAAPAEGTGEEAPVDKEALAEANYAQRREDMRKEKEEKDLKERIERSRNRSALNAKLKGKTLGTSNEDDKLDTKSWIKQQKKREKLRAAELARRAKEMEEADKAIYDERDLSGLKVGHDVDDFEEGEDVILTLKDNRILEGDEDELQNVNMVDDAAIKAAKERKRKAAEQYTGYDDEEFDENRIGIKADILGKYDDEFSSGKAKSEGFRLGAPIEKKMKIVDEDSEMGMAPVTKVKLNLDYTKEFEVSDYAKEGEKGFKKPKKKKAKRSTRKAEADGEDENGMEVDGEPTFQRRVVDQGPDNLVDDDDLQAALARSRRENAKKKPKIKPEDLAAQIAQQKQEEEAAQPLDGGDGDEDGRITFDDTSEFVRNVTLESLAAPVKKERAATPPSTSIANQQQQPVVVKIERSEEGEMDEDEDMSDEEDDALAEMAAREGLSLDEYRLKIDSQMQEMENIKKEEAGVPTESEPVVGNGVAGILSMLRNQGALKSATEEEKERERVQKEKDLWLADHRRRVAQREMERIMSRGGNKDQAQREYENRMREQQEARDALESYKTYRPDINIVYTDEFGRKMTPKEAWKSLSHKFHGKTSGRMKTEKRLKKIAEERKQATMGATDTPLGMTDAFTRRQQKTGEAHMVLSVGNRQSVPQNNKKR
ncbi:U4/U6.U5 tri-snRNP-associated protein 1 [Kwoniella mangroviensis CBS 10435]|uniref:U4/U6.U5 tri-snRNP-associated protein 1 n=1 Tax=Kwoniella mangroviensis CBS 10435 TaxID=1331196 RepID=A0A1B9J059_9TREE|nr:U4/U6.U5 tri-snRNP-associated protein 1 [Kwoniella mangroviensis CBS 10435]